MNTGSLIRDHLRRSFQATHGFEVAGSGWVLPWLAYFVSPALSWLFPGKTAKFKSFSARLGKGDLYVFANLFEDYRLDHLRRALADVSCVIDGGANVGAFSWLVLQTARELGRDIRITAIEPADDNVMFLRSQPFADRLNIVHGALGTEDGFGKLQTGINSVTHRVEASTEGLAVYGLEGLCREPVLLKLDIEGAEFGILRQGLPASVRAMFLEWHPGTEEDRPDDPQGLVTDGKWHLVSRDIYGASTWFWTRS